MTTELNHYCRLRPGIPRFVLEESHERLCSDYPGFMRSMEGKWGDPYPVPQGVVLVLLTCGPIGNPLITATLSRSEKHD